MCLLVLVFGNVEGNPGPPSVPPPPTQDPDAGGPAPYSNNTLLFISENVTIRLDEKAYIQADYTFENPLNESIETIIYLPFHYLQKKPKSLTILREESIVNYTWTNYSLPDTFNGYRKYKAVNFSLDFLPGERVTIIVTYTRSYVSNERYYQSHNLNEDHLDSHVSCFVYLARTGALWPDPIQYARFQFIIPKNQGTENLSEENIYSLYYSNWKDYYLNSWQKLRGVYLNTEFLWEHQSEDDTDLYLIKEYSNWTPVRDIGVVWEIPHPHPSDFNISYNESIMSYNFTLDGIGSQNYDVTNSNFSWKVNGEMISDKAILRYAFPSEGTYSIRLNVTCEFGFTKEIMKTIDVNMVNEPLDFSLDDYYQITEKIESRIRAVSWDMGDGTIIDGLMITHSYSHPGVYSIKITIDINHLSSHRYYSIHRKTTVYVMDIDSDEDWIVDSFDAFPLDPAASVDRDGDGKPEEWNPGMSEEDSTTGLQLDEPDDLFMDGLWISRGFVMTALIIAIIMSSIVVWKRKALSNQ